MNSAVKPALTSSSPQNSSVSVQINKPMHPQGAQGSYGPSSSHLPQSLVNLPHNPNIAHAHPNPAHQTNHYSLNVPNTLQHYTSNNPSNIPSSNHPVANVTQPSTGGQTYTPTNKNVPYTGGYQPNLGHPPNQHSLPPVSQTLPATQTSHHVVEAAPEQPAVKNQEKPHSNGTLDVKTAPCEHQENHVGVAKEKVTGPSSPPKVERKEEEVPLSTPPKQKVEKEDSVSNSVAKVSPSSETVESEPKKEASSSEHVEDKAKVAEEVHATAETSKSEEQTPVTPRISTPKSPTRKSKTPKSETDSPRTSKADIKTSQKTPPAGTKSKRARIKTQHYQSPLPEIEIITKITSSTPRSKNQDEKLIVFYKNEFLAVRNSEGGFYICRAVQNIYKSSPKILIRWLSLDKNDKSGEIYTPDFYDHTDFDCILTNLNLTRVDKGKYRLPPAEKERTDSILKRSLAVEKGEVTSPSLTEEHPDGLDLSLYKEESQLKKRKATKRKAKSALRSGKKANTTTKSPDQSKVRKVVAKPKRGAPTPRAVPSKTRKSIPEVTKTSTSTSRTDRAKRRSDNQNVNKVSPVVDPKKARVLAKVARKGATSSKTQALKKTTKSSAPSSKVQKAAPKVSAKKTKRSSKK